MKNSQLPEPSTPTIDSKHERDREDLTSVLENIHTLEEVGPGTAANRSKLALVDFEVLYARLEENVAAARHVAANAAVAAHEGLSRRISWLKARVLLLLAQAKANRALAAAMDQRFPEAETLLDEAMELMRGAAQDLASQSQFWLLIENIRRASLEVSTCIRSHARWTAEKMDRLFRESERLVRKLEKDERIAASQN